MESQQPAPTLEISASRQLTAWMAETGISFAFTTYQIGKLFFVGLKPDGGLSLFERSFNRSMGLCAQGDSLYLGSLYQIWRFENLLEPGQTQDGYDRLYLPQVGYTTGDVDAHDLGVDRDGRLIFVNTLFSCLATLSESHSFVPVWKPPFISKLAAEDRCHLNGLAMRDGLPAFVTAISRSDAADGWRDRRRDGGVVVEVGSGETVLSGLSMPHSPRWHDGRLWLLNSGTGEFGYVDAAAGRFEPVCFCPGYLRGLSFHGAYALVGLSKPRHNKTFAGLALDGRLQGRDVEPRCGVQVIDLRSGDLVHWLRLDGLVEELYDVVALPGARRPMALGFKTDEIRRVLNVGPFSG
ncbi:TIGR03032 family protein [Methylomagnum ishizawai]|uniref:TIGR03032 family protein n=1 Tax=Methylomagnum ishizawai TaxID=1760988 RepID=A0A1Y6CWU6_9GAMM|nr:TIGR03032 family protein [Methylomagnum ishizawai]SMF94841.1 TIGR03032 family protein [Methylomagnum ishizawai]